MFFLHLGCYSNSYIVVYVSTSSFHMMYLDRHCSMDLIYVLVISFFLVLLILLIIFSCSSLGDSFVYYLCTRVSCVIIKISVTHIYRKLVYLLHERCILALYLLHMF
jgi:hypothetical protein